MSKPALESPSLFGAWIKICENHHLLGLGYVISNEEAAKKQASLELNFEQIDFKVYKTKTKTAKMWIFLNKIFFGQKWKMFYVDIANVGISTSGSLFD